MDASRAKLTNLNQTSFPRHEFKRRQLTRTLRGRRENMVSLKVAAGVSRLQPTRTPIYTSAAFIPYGGAGRYISLSSRHVPPKGGTQMYPKKCTNPHYILHECPPTKTCNSFFFYWMVRLQLIFTCQRRKSQHVHERFASRRDVPENVFWQHRPSTPHLISSCHSCKFLCSFNHAIHSLQCTCGKMYCVRIGIFNPSGQCILNDFSHLHYHR